MKIWIDGVCEPNPYGDTGIGIYFEDGTEISRKIEPATNNVAEYTALLTAMEEAIRRNIEEVEILTDSQLLVNQVSGNWKIESETSRKFVPRIRKLKKNFKKFKLRWIPREENEKADMLSKKAIGYNGNRNKRF
ncbi:MAG: ribonuclease HI family protein [Candidatus Aenigmatarchaeota archaeon]